MQRIVFALLAIAALLAASNAAARIGETESQIELRYGKPFARDTPQGSLRMIAYRKDQMQIGVVYQDGKSASEFYSKLDKSALSETEISVLLDANSAGGTWAKSPGVPMWKLDSVAYVATYDGRNLIVCTQQFLEASAAERKKTEKQS